MPILTSGVERAQFIDMGVCVFGQYEVLARLASGGAASIYLARVPTSAGPVPYRLVCLKTPLPERARDDDFVAMFVDEAKLARRLIHPSCVQTEAFGEEHGLRYIVMEFVHGFTLWELLTTVPKTGKALPPLGVAQCLSLACRGLNFAHALKGDDGHAFNIVHRDISPQNLMVTNDGRVKVLDFGVARAETGRHATATGIVKGKFSYMSPEQITGSRIDHRSDLYSMGIIMFECLASRRLYRANSPQEVAALMLEHRPPNLSDLVEDIDPQLEAICNKALSRKPEDRYSSADEMADELDEYLAVNVQSKESNLLVDVVGERFGTELEVRNRVLNDLRNGTFDEKAVTEAFNARPVYELDFKTSVSGESAMDSDLQRLPFAIDLEASPDKTASDSEYLSGATSLSGDEQTEHPAPISGADGIVTRLVESAPVPDKTHVISELVSANVNADTSMAPAANHTSRHFSDAELTSDESTSRRETIPVQSGRRTRNILSSKSSTQSFTLGVVLIAFALGIGLGIAIGLVMGAKLGLSGF